MRFEDMKNNIPETPDFIHEMIKNEVDRQLQETKIIAIPKKRKRWNKARVAAATIVCVLATTTAAYAGVKMYRMYVEKQGDYSVKTGITSENKLADLPAQILLPDTLPAPSLLLQEPRFLLLKGPLYTPADDLPVPYPYVPSSPVPV